MVRATQASPLTGSPVEAAAPGVQRRRFLQGTGALGLAAASSSWLTACGSGDVVSAISPDRFIVFGDGLSDVGQGGGRYTINDGSVNIWAERLASRYGKTVTSQAAGGLGFAQGHAADAALPRTLDAQIAAFLAGNTFRSQDVVLINLPMAGVLGPAAAVKAGTLTTSAALAQADATGTAHAATVKQLIAAGAKYVVVCGVYDLAKSPFATQQNQVTLMGDATLKLNDAFKVAAVNLANNLLYVDAAFLVNRNADTKTGPAFGFTNATAGICTTPTALTCNDSTLVSTGKAQYVFADSIHLTPACQVSLGDYAYDQFHARW